MLFHRFVRATTVATLTLMTAGAVASCTSAGIPEAASTAPVQTAPSVATSPTPTPTTAAAPASGSASDQPGSPGTSAAVSPSRLSEISDPLPGMPAVDDPANVYSHDGPGMLSPTVRTYPNLVYVPNSGSNTVDVIDPSNGTIVNHFAVPAQPQHVVPSYDLKTLWVNSDVGNALVPIDPATGTPGKPVQVDDPYNLYFTPDGRFAVVMAERLHRIDWRDPHTMALIHSTTVPCKGVNHADFSANGRYLIVSCEFDGQLLKVDTVSQKVVGRLTLAKNAMPQDVKMSPDGRVFYIADMQSNGVWEIDGDSFTRIGFIPTGKGAHGLYVSRDATVMYVTNRGEGSISLIDLATRAVRTTWRIPGGGSPDMGGLSVDGNELWLTGRYNDVVYDISTVDGHLIRTVRVGSGPHGLCVYPQPGRYSLGHTGVFR